MNNQESLSSIANQMVAKGKGILAADESTPTCTKRFESIGVESTYETRNEYRDMLMGADGLNEYISGVIMFDETLDNQLLVMTRHLFQNIYLLEEYYPE